MSVAVDSIASPSSTSRHDKANVITTTIGGGLSMIGVTFILFSYCRIRGTRQNTTTAEKILLCVSSADFISAATSVIGVWFPSHNSGCTTEGFFIIFSLTASFFWTSCLTIHLFLVMVQQNGSTRKLLLCFHLVSWGLPLFLACFALGSGALGKSPSLTNRTNDIKLTTGGWCWIKQFREKSQTVVWTLMTSKFWELLSYFIITVLCLVIYCKLRHKLKTSVEVGENTIRAVKKAERRMMFIPVAFVLLRIWGTIRYFAYVSELPKSVTVPVMENIVLYALQGLGDCSQGFANSIFFCISNKHVSSYWKNVFVKHCSFLCYKESRQLRENSPLLQNNTKQLAIHI